MDMNNDPFTVTIPITLDKYEFLASILGSSYTTWYWWREETFDEGYEWNKFPADNDKPFITVGIIDPTDDDEERVITKRLCINDIIAGYAKAHAEGYRTRLDDIDAASGDTIMQYATLNDYVYA